LLSALLKFILRNHKIWRNLHLSFHVTNGQIISKCLFGVFNFFQKNRTKTCRILVKGIHSSVFWKNSQLDNLFSKLTDL
jgi:hypothetical protein